MPSLETICTVCGQPVGLMNPWRGPNTKRGLRKTSPHAVPPQPGQPKKARRPRCTGSALEVPDVAIYEVEGGVAERRQRRGAAQVSA